MIGVRCDLATMARLNTPVVTTGYLTRLDLAGFLPHRRMALSTRNSHTINARVASSIHVSRDGLMRASHDTLHDVHKAGGMPEGERDLSRCLRILQPYSSATQMTRAAASPPHPPPRARHLLPECHNLRRSRASRVEWVLGAPPLRTARPVIHRPCPSPRPPPAPR